MTTQRPKMPTRTQGRPDDAEEWSRFSWGTAELASGLGVDAMAGMTLDEDEIVLKV